MELSVIQTSVDTAALEALLLDQANSANFAAIQARIDALKAGSKPATAPAFKRAASTNWFATFGSATVTKVLHVGAPTTAQAGRGAGREVREAICLCANAYGHTANLRVSVWTNDEGVFSLPEAKQKLTITKGGSASNGEFWINVARRESDEIQWTEESLKLLELNARAAVALRKIAGSPANRPAAQADDEDLNG